LAVGIRGGNAFANELAGNGAQPVSFAQRFTVRRRFHDAVSVDIGRALAPLGAAGASQALLCIGGDAVSLVSLIVLVPHGAAAVIAANFSSAILFLRRDALSVLGAAMPHLADAGFLAVRIVAGLTLVALLRAKAQ